MEIEGALLRVPGWASPDGLRSSGPGRSVGLGTAATSAATAAAAATLSHAAAPPAVSLQWCRSPAELASEELPYTSRTAAFPAVRLRPAPSAASASPDTRKEAVSALLPAVLDVVCDTYQRAVVDCLSAAGWRWTGTFADPPGGLLVRDRTDSGVPPPRPRQQVATAASLGRPPFEGSLGAGDGEDEAPAPSGPAGAPAAAAGPPRLLPPRGPPPRRYQLPMSVIQVALSATSFSAGAARDTPPPPPWGRVCCGLMCTPMSSDQTFRSGQASRSCFARFPLRPGAPPCTAAASCFSLSAAGSPLMSMVC